MKYPRLPKRLDRRCKLTDRNISQIRKLRKKGIKILKISDKFNVCTNTIHYWTNEKFRRKTIEVAKIHALKTDIKIKRNRQLESIRYRFSLPKYGNLLKKYARERESKYRKNKRNK